MSETTPSVSILIPVFNRRQYIREAVRSSLEQTFEDIEVIISDNASDDGTWEVCEALAREDTRVRIFRNVENIGPVRNWMRCIENARGKYGKIVFSDDTIDRRYLERALPWMRQPDVGFVFCSAEIGSVPGRGCAMYRWREADGVYPSSAFVDDVLRGGDVPVSPGAALFRVDDLRKNLVTTPPGTDLDFSRHGAGTDMLLFLLTACEYPLVAYLRAPLVFFRAHEGSITINRLSSNAVRAAYHAARVWYEANNSGTGSAYRVLVRAWLSELKARRSWVSPSAIATEAGFRRFSALNPWFASALVREVGRRILVHVSRFTGRSRGAGEIS